MSELADGVGVEHLLAAAIIANGGELTVHGEDLKSPGIEGKYIHLQLNEDGTVTMKLEIFDDNNE